MVDEFSAAEEVEHEIKEIMENRSCSSNFFFLNVSTKYVNYQLLCMLSHKIS